jgi:hypothetical protein
LVVVILAVMWVLVLVPPLLRSRSDNRPSSSVVSFRQQLSTLGRANPVYARSGRPGSYRSAPPRPVAYRNPQPYRPTAYRSPSAYPQQLARAVARPYGPNYRMSERAMARRRRQSVLLTLVAVAFFTAVLAFGLGMPMMVWVHVGVDIMLAVYLFLLVQLRKVEEQRAARHWGGWYQQAA